MPGGRSLLFIHFCSLYPGCVEEQSGLAAAATLSDEVRRALYQYVRRQSGPVTREEAARAVRISVKLAAFHLDKLVDRGLLRTDQRLPTGARRPVGRAPKRYAPSDMQVSLSVPERRYELAGEILVDAFCQGDPTVRSTEAALQVARQRGRQLGAEARQARRLRQPGPERTMAIAENLLEQYGYEPSEDGEGGLVLRNCPFHSLAARAPELICGINAAFIDGVLRGLGNSTVQAELEPKPGLCCVRLVPPGCQRRPD